MSLQRFLVVFSGMTAVLLLGACATQTVERRSLTLFQETLALEDGGEATYERGVLETAVRRSLEGGDRIEVEFFRFPRQPGAPAEAPPIFMLRGGPGFGGLGPYLDRPGYYEDRIAPLTALSDVVIPGQRGFGSSGETPCGPSRELTAREVFDDDLLAEALSDATEECRRAWEEQGLDLGGFTVVEAAADVAEIATELGYGAIQLWGVSFGSHWAMTVMRNHPELVARATLGGLEGPDHTYDMPSDYLAALERIAAAAEASPELSAAMPAEGLLAAYRSLVEAADGNPIAVSVDHDGEALQVELDGDALRSLVRGYSGSTAFRHRMVAWPKDLLAMISGDFQEAAVDYVDDRLDRDMSDAAFFLIDCASGISEERGERLRNDPAAALVGRTWRFYDVACAAWDADLGEDFRRPFESDIPTLLVQGNWDTSTPYENAVELRPFFRRHRFVHVEGGSHGALREAREEVEGFREAVDHWLATGELEAIPERVELPPMAWSAP
ncbi:MAG: alpha/beta fold hydrolase [Acidobacteriota bacterium]